MGKHSSPQQGHYYRSVAGWILPWALIAFVLAIAVLVAFDVLSKDPVRTSADGPPAAGPKNDGPKSKPEPTEQPTAAPTATPEPTLEPEPTTKPAKEPKLSGKGFDVQVLNGTSDPDADDLMADRLARLGFTVVAVEPAAGGYPETTVFFSRGSEEDLAGRLGDKYGWIVEPAPDNLSREVDLHVIVGDDEL